MVKGLLSNEHILRSHGIGKRNYNLERFIDFYGRNDRLVTGIICPHKLIHRQTWTSPGGRTRNQIDHMFVNRQHQTSIMDTRATREADIACDNLLVS